MATKKTKVIDENPANIEDGALPVGEPSDFVPAATAESETLILPMEITLKKGTEEQKQDAIRLAKERGYTLFINGRLINKGTGVPLKLHFPD